MQATLVFAAINETTVSAHLRLGNSLKKATARLSPKGIAAVREWARKKAGEGVTITEKVEDRQLQESHRVQYLEQNDAVALKLAQASFPGYTGRKFKVEVVPEGTRIDMTSYWDGGTRDYFAVVNLATMKGVQIPENGGLNSPHKQPIEGKVIEGMCIVQHTIFQGKDIGLTFTISEKNAAQLLPASNQELTKEEKIILVILRSLKPSYRRDEAGRFGIKPDVYQKLISQLQTKGLVAAGGGITPKGKNAVGDIRDLYQIEKEV